MKVTVIQQDIEWKNPQANLERAEQLMRASGKSDLFVLPEMFATGFCMEPSDIAEPSGGAVSVWMKRMAGSLDAAVAGSVAVEEDGKFYNRFYFMTPEGDVHFYDKRHLFSYSGENLRYTAGTRRCVVAFRGVRILLQVCYDLRFPVWSRNKGDYDLALYVASWPVNRIQVWNLLLKARAMENQCYVVGANRVGADPVCEYTGGSVVVDPYGRVAASCEDGVSGFASVDVDMEKLRAFRKKFPVLEDADDYSLMEIWQR